MTISISGTLTGTATASEPEDLTTTIVLTLGSPTMTINGVPRPIDGRGTTPIAKSGRALVPLRPIFEALSLTVGWDGRTGAITGTQGNTVISLTVGSRLASINGRSTTLEVAPEIIGGRTMVPLRFIAESLGADVRWRESTQTITITLTPLHVRLNGIYVIIGDRLENVQSILGEANRIDPSHWDFDWHVYNSDYSQFIMVGIKNGLVEAIYTNSRGFVTGNAQHGVTTRGSVNDIDGITLHYDRHDRNTVHAVLIVSPSAARVSTASNALYRAQELQNFDATNAFRVSRGLPALLWDDIAARTSREHSQDMADNNYFSHNSRDGSTPFQRFTRNGGRFNSAGENIAAGFIMGIDYHNEWLNSTTGHRDNLLGSFTHLGVGHGHNASSMYRTYMSQFFFR